MNEASNAKEAERNGKEAEKGKGGREMKGR